MRKYLKKYIFSLRYFRIWHRYIGLVVFAIMFLSAATGALLAWKKDISLLQPPTQKGVSKELATWKPVEELAEIAIKAFEEKHPEQKGNPIDRMDVRPSKGIVKVCLENGWWEVQVDGTTGEVKSIAKRHSDWIEKLHDLSIISDLFKLISMNFLGFGLIIMITTGVWLWMGPKVIRRIKRRH